MRFVLIVLITDLISRADVVKNSLVMIALRRASMRIDGMRTV